VPGLINPPLYYDIVGPEPKQQLSILTGGNLSSKFRTRRKLKRSNKKCLPVFLFKGTVSQKSWQDEALGCYSRLGAICKNRYWFLNFSDRPFSSYNFQNLILAKYQFGIWRQALCLWNAHRQNFGILSTIPERIDWYPVHQWVPPPHILNATTEHRIPKVSSNWLIGCQLNPVRQLGYCGFIN
jgi:hypothetical protein